MPHFRVPAKPYQPLTMVHRLHIFNPEHDLVMAGDKQGQRLTPPRAARELRLDLGFLPAFMAEDGDWVMVDDVEVAHRAAEPFAAYLPKVEYLLPKQVAQRLAHEALPLSCCPWGWDADIRAQLAEVGVEEASLPGEGTIRTIRQWSHRAHTIGLLEELVGDHPWTVGERRRADTLAEVKALLHQWKRAVVKAPWSSSGRGVRFVGGELTASEEGYIRHVLEQQHSIVVEPFYDCLLNFALEWGLTGRGATFDGISVFRNTGAAYEGNLLASEEEKRMMLSEHVPLMALDEICRHLGFWLETLTERVFGMERERGNDGLCPLPVGVDMMLVRTPLGIRVHPCVEINVRCTMGHVALHVARRTPMEKHSMAIRYDEGRYALAVE